MSAIFCRDVSGFPMSGQDSCPGFRNKNAVLIYFQSIPGGASVYIDGDLICGGTPCIRLLTGELHEVSMHAPGNYPETRMNAFFRDGDVEWDLIPEDSPNRRDDLSPADRSDICDDMVEVPGGPFWMGCDELTDKRCVGFVDDERPYRKINLHSFQIDRYEVTTADYKKCVDAGSCSVPRKHSFIRRCTYMLPGKERHPINCVTWEQANSFCRWAGKRLPTEAEWEKAARGSDGMNYPWGNKKALSCEYAVMNDSVSDNGGCGNGGTMPVGSKKKGLSPYGAMDMIGNVGEWVSSWYDIDYYAKSPQNDPQGPMTGKFRVVRGGSWKLPIRAINNRVTFRDFDDPKRDDDDIGFRCAR
jgi:formylglycine-generating enzyme required for sulfatase activity